VSNVLRLHFLDSDCTIIEHPGGNLTMVDMGTTGRTDPVDYYCQHFSAYSEGRRQPRELFRFIATHPDMDHISGLARLVARVPVANFWYVAPNVQKDDFEGSPHREEDWRTFQRLVHGTPPPRPISPKFGETGHFWTDDNIHIWAPWPQAEQDAERTNRPNLASYILAIRHGQGLIVLGGDAEAVIWQALYERYRRLPRVTVLKAPHHGHDSAYYQPAVAAMRPELTIVTSDGDREHDASGLYRRYSRTLLRTDLHGNIVVTVSPNGTFTYESDRARDLARRFLAPPPLPAWPASPWSPRTPVPIPPPPAPPRTLSTPSWPPYTYLR